ncbi:MAG TPA: 1-deoxy-D-xylulose-5-phosphate reductoisomerase [Candidatus Obscuribacterales bacterium]
MPQKKIALLGSTGSIGRQTLDIVAAHQDLLQVTGLAAGSKNLSTLAEQIAVFEPQVVSVPTAEDAGRLRSMLGKSASPVEIMHGTEGLESVAAETDAETVVTGVVGFLGLAPTARAIRKGKTIALANKETLVAAGGVIMRMIQEHGARIVPVDSEHSAIFQSLSGYDTRALEKIWLTASGGPFRTWSIDRIKSATKNDALKHPNWSMGPKITVDSATLMNKGLEIIEARWLFDIPVERINVVIHPQSILHSAVEFVDGSIVGQLGVPDMRLPIHYALFYPQRVKSERVPRLDLRKLSTLTFEEPDLEKFPCLRLVRQVASEDSTLPCVLNAANEAVVAAFLGDRIKFHQIPAHIERVLERHKPVSKPSLEDILEADSWARKEADSLLRVAADKRR